MKKLLVAIFLFVLSLNASNIDLWKSSTLYKVLQKGELRVGVSPGYIPLEMTDKEGKIIGFDVDIAKLMAKEMGVKLKIVPIEFDGIVAGLVAEKFDIIIAGIAINQKRNLSVNFTIPYMVIGQSFLVDSKKYPNAKWEDFNKKDKIIVTKLGVSGEYVAKKTFPNAGLKTFDTEVDAIQEVVNGRADAFIYDGPFNSLYILKNPKANLLQIEMGENAHYYEPLAFAIRKGDPDFLNWLNNYIDQIKHDGRYDLMYNKWFKNRSWMEKVN